MAPAPTPHRVSTNRVNELLTRVAAVVAILSLLGGTVLALFLATTRAELQEIEKQHTLFLFGTPLAAMMALVVVGLYRATTTEPIEIKMPFSFEFKGASGPVVLWIFTYLACVAGMCALWKAA